MLTPKQLAAIERAAARTTTLTYTAHDGPRHVCTDDADSITDYADTLDTKVARRETYSLARRDSLRPCCWSTYGRMHS